MIAVLVGLVSLVAVVAGPLSLYEFRLYTAEQKARARRLARVYLGVVLLLVAVGLVGLASAAVGAVNSFAYFGILALLAAMHAVVQNRMHRKMGVEGSPLVDRVAQNWL